MDQRSTSHRGCSELEHWSRRQFLTVSTAAAAAASAPAWLPSVALAQGGATAEPRDVLVLIFLRGGMDGLTTCVPHGDPALYAARPTLAVPPPGAPGGALDLDGFFGLAPAAAPLLTPWSNGHLAFVHATGSTDPTRSHFEAFTRMEFAIPLQPLGGVSSGWLARHLQSTPALGSGALRAAAVADILPKTLAQAPLSLPIADFDAFAFPGDPTTAAAREAALKLMYTRFPAPLGPTALGTIGTIHLLDTIDFAGYVPAAGASYPSGSELATGLRSTAALIKADVGVEAVMLERGGWDLHAKLGPSDGDMALLLDELARSLEAFYLDMLGHIGHLVLVVQSEFGRRVAENGSLGLDHGHGNCMLLMGGHVAGGQVHGAWPTLAPAALDQGDVAITTDYRDVLAEILAKRLGSTQLGYVFPGHVPSFPGVIV